LRGHTTHDAASEFHNYNILRLCKYEQSVVCLTDRVSSFIIKNQRWQFWLKAPI
jgi:hypothetical protein